jgi:uncharacterized protein YkvS
MKIFTGLLFIAVTFACCTMDKSKQDKAEAAVKKYIKLNANVASSYEPLAYGRLDSIYRTDTSAFEELDLERKQVVIKYNKAKAEGNTGEAKAFKDQLLLIDEKIENNKVLTGLRIYHVFHGKNSEGAQVINRGSFYLDSNLVVQDFIMSEDSVMMLQQD